MKAYRALVGLTYPATREDVDLHKAGEPCEWKIVEAGETVSDIPEESIAWLKKDKRIEEVKDDKEVIRSLPSLPEGRRLR